MNIIGISAFYHDSAACLIKDGEIVAAAQEERFTRIKHDPGFPLNAIEFCIKEGNITPNQIDNIVFYEKPFVKFERLIETYLAFAPKGFNSFIKSMPLWIKDKLFQKNKIEENLKKIFLDSLKIKEKILFSEHHLSHAASAFYPSPFENAAILTLDGVGEWTTTSLAIGEKNNIEIIKEIKFPHSLGLLYSAFTYYTGFKVNSGEYKLMGLAPYGEPKYVDVIKDNLIEIAEDGSFQLNMSFFDYATDLKMTNKKFNSIFGSEPRKSETLITQKEMDLAASIQKVTEEIIIRLGRNIHKETRQKNLCMAGGVALNCVANGFLHREKIFKKIWIQPASGDAGGAIGAALAAYHIHHSKERKKSLNQDAMRGSYLGPKFTDSEIEKELIKCGAVYKKLTQNKMLDEVTNAIIDQKAVGWMQGAMEFGPRSLGARSILADPRSPIMQKQLNLKVKFRESFRPFAPSILREDVNTWFQFNDDSPYMLFVAEIQKNKKLKMTSKQEKLFGIDKLNVQRSTIPSVTHIDYSARIQTVHKETNSVFYSLLKKFKSKTSFPLLVNTSFNVRGEPIVCTPTDAFKCFMGTGLDILVIGNFYMIKNDQDKKLKIDYQNLYELD